MVVNDLRFSVPQDALLEYGSDWGEDRGIAEFQNKVDCSLWRFFQLIRVYLMSLLVEFNVIMFMQKEESVLGLVLLPSSVICSLRDVTERYVHVFIILKWMESWGMLTTTK